MATRIRITRPVDEGDIVKQIAPKVGNLGRAVGRRMQRLVPKRSWALHDTITTGDPTIRGARVEVEVGFGGGDVDYGMHVERGTSRMRAQPFARPALAQSRAGELNYAGEGPTPHGVISVSTRRTRMRGRRGA